MAIKNILQKMNIVIWAKEKIKKMDFFDIALVKIGSATFGVLLVFFIPELLKINIWWFVAIFVLTLVRPFYRIYFK